MMLNMQDILWGDNHYNTPIAASSSDTVAIVAGSVGGVLALVLITAAIVGIVYVRRVEREKALKQWIISPDDMKQTTVGALIELLFE
jgi:hypothetical protein